MIARHWLLQLIVLLTVGIVTLLPLHGAQPAKSPALTVEEVIKLSQSGFAEELIITKIKKNGKAFDLSAEELLDIKKAGVSDNVIRFLLDPSLVYTPPPPPAPPPSPGPAPPVAAPAKKYPPDALAARVPWDPGLYHFEKDNPIKIDVKMLLGAEGAGVKVLKLKGKTSAYLVGPASKTRIRELAPTFYMRLPEGKAIEEIVLIALVRKKNRREVDMGAGPKPELKGNAMRQFDSVEVGVRLYKITTSKLAKGEYLFFMVGSAEPPKGSQGKGYDFGIEEPTSK
jgi:hypothetical protein